MFRDYRLILLFSNINKILVKSLCITEFIVFSKEKKIRYSPEYGFWQEYSTNHDNIYLIDKTKNENEKSVYGYGISVGFKMAFDVVDQHIL